MVKMGQTHRRRDVGEARDGGATRDRATGHGRGRAWARWRAFAGARRTVVVAGPVVAGTDDGELVSGGRSSGIDGINDTARGRTSGLQLHVLRELTNPTEARTGPFGHRSLVSDELVRRRHTGLAVISVAARNRPWGEGKMTAGLTGSRMGGSFGSGKRRSERDGEADLRWPRRGKTSGAALRGFWRGVARWRGRGGRGGACRHSEGSRGRRWPRRYGGTAAAALGLEREREQKRGEEFGRE